MSDRRQRLEQAALYLVCDAVSDAFVTRALRGGVDLVQLRMKDAGDEEIIATGRRLRAAVRAAGALLIVNDRPDLAAALDADGVHVGQDDMAVARARETVGAQRLVGLSTHSAGQIEAAANAGADYIGVGPVHATPTKPGRAPVGLELVRYAAGHSPLPFFAIGGIDTTNVAAVRAAGARRIAVVRALTESDDPEAAAAALRDAVADESRRTEARLGAA
ncbi:MAG: thiamine phosphate synthase [Solirubrobacteraceae bacterium]